MPEISRHNYKWWIFLAMSIAALMSNLELTAMNLTLAAISRNLHLSLHSMQWIINAFLLFYASLMVTGGKLADLFGRRYIFFIGMIVFIAASLFGGFAQNTWEIIVSRIFQGIGSAIGVSLTTGIIYTAFPEQQRNMALGLLTGVVGFSLALGPTLGGFLTQYLSWRWIFWINAPLGLISILLAMFFTPPNNIPTKKIQIDFLGILLLTGALFLLIFTLNQMGHWQGTTTLGFLLFSLLLFVIFYRWEKKFAEPLISIDILHNKLFLLGCIVRLLMMYILYVPLFIISLFMQNILNYSPSQSGLLFLWMTLTIGLLSPFGGWLMHHIGTRLALLIAIPLAILVFYLLAQLNTQSTAADLAQLLFLAGIVYSIFSPAILRASMLTIPDEKASVASGMFYTMSVTGGALSIALASSIMSRQGRNQLLNLTKANHIYLNRGQANVVMQTIYSSHSGQNRHLHFINFKILSLAQQAFVHAYAQIMLLGMTFAIVSLAIIYFGFNHQQRMKIHNHT